MKKVWLCLLFFLSGCVNGYTLIRESDSDVIKIIILTDENEREWVSSPTDNTEVVFCQSDCKQEIKNDEDEYVDGIVAVGEAALQAVS